MRIQKMRHESKIWVGILSLSVALSGAPAFADDGGGIGGFFSQFASGIANAVSSMASALSSSPSSSSSSQQQSVPVEDRSFNDHSRGARAAAPAPQEEHPLASSTTPATTSSAARSSDDSGGSSFLSRIFTSGPIESQDAQDTRPNVPVTHDSSYQVAGVVPEGARWMMIQIEKEGDETNGGTAPAVGVTPGQPIPKAYFLDGPGMYKVDIFYSTSERVDANTYSNFVSSTRVQNTDTRDMTSLLASNQVQSDSPEIVSLAAELTQNKVTDREKALAIHDWVADNISYDTEGLRTNTYASHPLDALTILHKQVAVCEGYSDLFAALMRAAGVRTRVVHGIIFRTDRPAELSDEQICKSSDPRFGGHAWNEAYIDNRWVSIDTTWDSGFTSVNDPTATFKHTYGEHKYFDPSPTNFGKDHLKCVEMRR